MSEKPASKAAPHFDSARRDTQLHSAVMAALQASPAGRDAIVQGFLKDLSYATGNRYSVGVGSRADALRISLLAVDAKNGAEVITSAFGHVATPAAIIQLGGVPRFIDVAQGGNTLDPKCLEKSISERTAAIIVTHQPNQTADMDAIMDIAVEAGVPVIEDGSAAIGRLHDGVRVGGFGDIAFFGFDAQARLHATGDAGAIVTNSGELAERLEHLARPICVSVKASSEIGWSSAIDVLQAAMLHTHLPYLELVQDVTEQVSMAALHEVPAFSDRCIAENLPNTRALTSARP